MGGHLSSSEVKDILNLIDDGFLFERFGQEFLAARLDYKFSASGGIKDKGIDGFEYTSESASDSKILYQLSIDKKPETKIKDTIEKLIKNKIDFTRLVYFTNIYIKNKDELIDHFADTKSITLRIFDSSWIANNSNNSPATQTVLNDFVKHHLGRFQKPGEGLVLCDHLSNPNLYVYLMHQIGRNDEINDLNKDLIDTLILYTLRDTDPDQKSFLSAVQIREAVTCLLDFEIERIQSKVNKRLKQLSKKPNKKINHHTDIDEYCLPFETRQEIVANNAQDKRLFDSFHSEAEEVLRGNLKGESVKVKNISTLLNKTLEKIFYRQGLEFSDFLLNKGCNDSFEGTLTDTVDEILDEARVVDKNRSKVKDALIVSIRHLIYNGSKDAKLYLHALSKTYLMLFLLKCDPQIVSFFQTMAGKMTIFVCTSILVPAFSEVYLEPRNQRYWGLLKAAKSRGVRLVVNDTIISELDFHIRRSKHIFDTEYRDHIDFYSDGSEQLVEQILVRAFIYALKEKKATTYDNFIDNFLSIEGQNTKQELIDFLDEEFGIEYVTKEDIDVEIDNDDYLMLVDKLADYKNSRDKAKNDANLILTIYAIRKKYGEEKSSLDGYKTWWLSSDTMTHRTITTLFKEKYPVSCYMRPDFLYNYISFTPPNESVSRVYKKTFPNLLGVHISHHINSDIAKSIRKAINEHSDKMDGRRKAKIRGLVDKLKSDPGYDYKEELKSFFQD